MAVRIIMSGRQEYEVNVNYARCKKNMKADVCDPE